MNIRLEMDNWIINDEYIITNGVIGYEVYKSGTEDTEAEEVYSSISKQLQRTVFNFSGESRYRISFKCKRYGYH